jgi:hypothetical protein
MPELNGAMLLQGKHIDLVPAVIPWSHLLQAGAGIKASVWAGWWPRGLCTWHMTQQQLVRILLSTMQVLQVWSSTVGHQLHRPQVSPANHNEGKALVALVCMSSHYIDTYWVKLQVLCIPIAVPSSSLRHQLVHVRLKPCKQVCQS